MNDLVLSEFLQLLFYVVGGGVTLAIVGTVLINAFYISLMIYAEVKKSTCQKARVKK